MHRMASDGEKVWQAQAPKPKRNGTALHRPGDCIFLGCAVLAVKKWPKPIPHR